MRRLWWRFLDRFWPVYEVGVDFAKVNDPWAVVVMQKKRNGTLMMLSSHTSYDAKEHE